MLNINEPYKICKKIENYKECIKLDLNEFDYSHPPELYNVIKETIYKDKSITHYSNFYNINTTNLLKSLSSFENVDENNILITAGSDDALEYIVNAYIKEDTKVLIFIPSYNYVELLVKRKTENIIYVSLPINNEELDISDVMEFYKDDVQVIYIVNPNNPLGTLIDKKHLYEIIFKYNKIKFIIDEAYIEFCKDNSCVIYKELDNMIITRTFSKAYGIAGLRLGYVISSNNIINKLKVLYNEKNVTEIAKVAGNYIITNNEYYKNIISEIKVVKENLEEFLLENNIYYIKSEANFVAFYVGNSYKEFLDILEQNNIYIRDRNSQINMKGFVRITIGTPMNIDKVKDIIKKNITLFENNLKSIIFTDKKSIWKLKNLFKKVLEIFSENDLINNYWLDGGSLLGYTRNNGIIPYDNDIDICIELSNVKLLLELQKSFDKYGLRLKRNRTDCYYQIDYLCDGNTEKTNDIHIDIFTLDNFINTDPRFQKQDQQKYQCNIEYTQEMVYPLKSGYFYNLKVNIPKEYLQLLKNALGEDCIENGIPYMGSHINVMDYTNA